MQKRNQKFDRKWRKKWETLGIWLDEECQQCGEKKHFDYAKYDSVGCVGCDIWLDGKCGDPKCPFCAKRPEKPSEAFFLESSMEKEWRRDNYRHKTSGEAKHMRRRERYHQILEDRNQRDM